MSNSLILLAIGFGAIWCLPRQVRSEGTSAAPRRDFSWPVPNIGDDLDDMLPHLPGPGHFAVKVIGDGLWRPVLDLLEPLARPNGGEGSTICDAVLSLDDFNPRERDAVSVHLSGMRVGHLDHEAVQDLGAALNRNGMAGELRLTVCARLHWRRADGIYAVSLDLPPGR